MTKFTIDNKALLFNYLYKNVAKALPATCSIRAANFSKSDISAYFLLKYAHNLWLTLRTADHPLWLKNAQQLQIDLGDPADLVRFSAHLKKCLALKKNNYFHITLAEISILNFLISLEQRGLICVLRLPAKISSSHKSLPLNLSMFMTQDFYLGQRNNLNHLLLPIKDEEFQKIVARLYGRNFLFSQFSGHSLLKLLPTNQWILPVLSDLDQKNTNWQQNCQQFLSDKTLLKQL